MSDNISLTQGTAQDSRNISITALLTAISTGIALSAAQILVFTLIKNKLVRIYQPKTYLVPERQRTSPPPRSAFGWMASIFKYKDIDIINKCGLDAYFFLRYLQTLLFILVPLACLLLPVLLPLNYTGGGQVTNSDAQKSAADEDMPAGLDTLAWGNISPDKTRRYWAHLILAVVVVIWVCYVFYAELRVYVRVRQDYLTSAEHRLRASATTVLVTDIPNEWLTTEALSVLYDVFPGGIRNIWVNRDYRKMLQKVRAREGIVSMLESAETELIRKCKQAQLKQQNARANNHKLRRYDTQEEEEYAAVKAAQDAQGEGVSSGNLYQVYHSVEEAIEAVKAKEEHGGWLEFNKAAAGSLTAAGKGLGRGLGSVGTAEKTIVTNAMKDVDEIIDTTNGFVNIAYTAPERDLSLSTYVSRDTTNGTAPARSSKTPTTSSPQDANLGHPPYTSTGGGKNQNIIGPGLNRRPSILGAVGGDGAKDLKYSWWKFWSGPSGGFPLPLPHGYVKNETTRDKVFNTSGLQHLIAMAEANVKKSPEQKYRPHIDHSYKEDEAGALWNKYIKKANRSTHRIPRFGIGLLPYVCPWLNKKVDTIYWCREELARLNVEIEYDQDHSDDLPRTNSAFIQFNQQIAAHMAVQAVSHHTPNHMAKRIIEVSPTDIIWDNMSMKWWESWLRTGITFAVAACMCLLWAIPVSATALLGNIPDLIKKYHWLGVLAAAENALKHVAGILPAIVLAILKLLPPIIFYRLATLQGNRTGKLRELSVQNYYFFFLFVQVFLVVSVSNGTFATLARTGSVTSVPTLMAQNLPKASNYFFSYMFIQALSTSASSLLQVGTLIKWFLMPKTVDNTARKRWLRNTSLSTVKWGTYFPTYTNFACISIIYSTIAPLIIVFAIITFTVLWIANRYCMLYVYNYTEDTGGLLYPRAINQTFVGLYVMEVCLIGLFFLVRDSENNKACLPHAIIMIVVMVMTALFQILLDRSFGPLYEHLPISFEDDAVLRDEVFARDQAARLEEDDKYNVNPQHQVDPVTSAISCDNDNHPAGSTVYRDHPDVSPNAIHASGTRAAKGSRNLDPDKGGRRRKDVEAQKIMGEVLFGGYCDEIEDLRPTERDALVNVAFQHEALRAKRPNVWVPHDDLGISDGEVERTDKFCMGNVWITNKGTSLDGKLDYAMSYVCYTAWLEGGEAASIIILHSAVICTED
ncbi:hypothetical protein V496_09797 [Pseudogymnoascus sp. VKM F-4515 (FW-2607)]|nr:hypothetical protein V496_09797 [Pseudogymnoascus sp. VKM F-4515 (FW-2607)]